MHLQKPFRIITKGNNSHQLVPSPYFSSISICSVDINVNAKLDKIPLMTLQDNKETVSMH